MTPVGTVHSIPVWELTTGEGALWAITGWELDTIEQIDPRTNAVVATMSTRITEERPAIAATAIRMLAQPMPTWSKASEMGAPAERPVYFTMQVITKQTRM